MTDVVTDKPTVLVVDDSRLMRVAASKILNNSFDVLEAEDGEVAWAMLQENTAVTLVISDLSMPNLDGLALLGQIRTSQRSDISRLPVIIVTGAEDDDGSKDSALSAGASDFITKPFDSAQLTSRVQAQIKQRRTEKALQQSEQRTQQLEQRNSVDELTGLANQRAFTDHVEEELSFAIRHRTDVAVLALQLDKYKLLFLRRGKETAEDILGQVAGILCADRRCEDTVARIGPDSFAVLLPGANPIGARRLAEQLRDTVEHHAFSSHGESFSLTASVAVSCPFIHQETRAADLLVDASEKLKSAHHAGGNCVVHKSDDAESEPGAAHAPDARAVQSHERTPVANSHEVQRALEDLSLGQHPQASITALIRATLPLFEEWSRTQDNRHHGLIEQLRSALQADEDTHPALPTEATESLQSY
jgi:diguanylate cyclase (GGDEF)-like protein